MWVLFELARRWLYYTVQQCPENTVDESAPFMVAAMLCQLPSLVYYSVSAQAAWSRRLWWGALAVLFFYNGLVLWGVSSLFPSINNGDAECGAREKFRPCEEVSVMFFVFGYWAQHISFEFPSLVNSKEAHKGANSRQAVTVVFRLLYQGTFLLVVACACAYSQVALHQFDTQMVLCAASIGLVNGLCMGWTFYSIILPGSEHYVLKTMARIFCISCDKGE